HTGQHYDYEMSKVFFEDLELSEPDIHLGVGSGTHAEQTGRVMIEFEKILFKEAPDLVIVVGDVNSTLACALTSIKLHIPVAHVEAGLRSLDRTMPEEINRLLTDAISDYLFTPSQDANENLKREGIPNDKIFLVGDVMVDSLLFNLDKARKSNILKKWGLQKEFPTDNCQLTTDYALLTLHRPSNVDDKESFLNIINALTEISRHIPIIFPIHPRTIEQIETFGFQHYFIDLTNNELRITNNGICLVDPLGYLDFLKLMIYSKFIMTDSGGIQEETTVLDVPCLTLRDTTERPITISQGTNILVHNDTGRITNEASRILEGKAKKGECPELWNGRAAERIVEIIVND
ncbi:UDP-N-acetylglucosamine 2-epimerase (non-hydrolyzing), partial [bacterium]|nr:UDP-N-acetylglucosamine 2-epimerase (non-hydrolyzing) [bacterium]